jgi:hypothetical protein
VVVEGLSALRSDLEAIARQVSLVGDGHAEVAGRPSPVAAAEGPCAGLAQAIYGAFYCRPEGAPPAPGDRDGFLEALGRANPVAPRWEAWTVGASDAWGLILSQPSGAVRRATPAEMASASGAPVTGGTVYLPAARELLTGPDGHYAILGRPVAPAESGRQVRFYWNLEPAGAARFLAAVGAGLDRRRIPFQAKVPASPQGYCRADAGVLYLAAEDVAAALDIVASAHADLADALEDRTPCFVRRLGRGLAFAESPSSGESFGMHRCRLVAEGLVQAGGGASEAAKAEAALARLAAYGLDPDAVERNAGTAYPYDFSLLAEAAQ